MESYNTKQESKHIRYLDANNLYGYVMFKFLPTSSFKWTDPKESYLNKYSSNSSKGYILELDLEYPKELRELYNDYPLTPHKIEIKREMLSDYQVKIADLYNSPTDNVKKLVPNFFDKEKFVIHYQNVQLYLRLGLKLKKKKKNIYIYIYIYRVLEFNQFEWPKHYVEFNTKKEKKQKKMVTKMEKRYTN